MRWLGCRAENLASAMVVKPLACLRAVAFLMLRHMRAVFSSMKMTLSLTSSWPYLDSSKCCGRGDRIRTLCESGGASLIIDVRSGKTILLAEICCMKFRFSSLGGGSLLISGASSSYGGSSLWGGSVTYEGGGEAVCWLVPWITGRFVIQDIKLTFPGVDCWDVLFIVTRWLIWPWYALTDC